MKQRWLNEEDVAERMDGWMKEIDKEKRRERLFAEGEKIARYSEKGYEIDFHFCPKFIW